jgi:hypothetical protein
VHPLSALLLDLSFNCTALRVPVTFLYYHCIGGFIPRSKSSVMLQCARMRLARNFLPPVQKPLCGEFSCQTRTRRSFSSSASPAQQAPRTTLLIDGSNIAVRSFFAVKGALCMCVCMCMCVCNVCQDQNTIRSLPHSLAYTRMHKCAGLSSSSQTPTNVIQVRICVYVHLHVYIYMFMCTCIYSLDVYTHLQGYMNTCFALQKKFGASNDDVVHFFDIQRESDHRNDIYPGYKEGVDVWMCVCVSSSVSTLSIAISSPSIHFACIHAYPGRTSLAEEYYQQLPILKVC